MYIKRVEVENIRSIDRFEMKFNKPSGWHVLIGENGSGKTTILKSIALALVGSEQSAGLRENWQEWLRKGKVDGKIFINLIGNSTIEYNKYIGNRDFLKNRFNRIVLPSSMMLPFYGINNTINFNIAEESGLFNFEYIFEEVEFEGDVHWDNIPGWFSAGFGPFRRFTGESNELKGIYKNPQLVHLSSHLTLFDESVALTETTEWLKDLQFQKLEDKNNRQLDYIIEFINSDDFLPDGTKLHSITSSGVTFIDGNGISVNIKELSDGFRSILSLTFEILRQLMLHYSYLSRVIFKKMPDGQLIINVPGIILIDEIDAHLHPTWQTKIGEWFTKYFPNIQFIVTTHSPLICRACEKGSIWRLAAPGSETKSGEITGTDRDRLIYGNVLDAYGTEVFGEDVSQSANAEEMLKELADLNVKSFQGTISESDKQRMQELKKILPTE